LYWLGARYYDPIAGRFISCDPYGHDADPSLYAFCGGDPVNGFDANGRFVTAGNLYDDLNLNNAQREQGFIEGNRITAPFVAATGVAIATGGIATPVLAGWGLSGGTLTLASGGLAAGYADLTLQGSQMALGDRASYNPNQTAISVGLGAGISYIAPYAANFITRPFTTPSAAELPAVVQSVAQSEWFMARAANAGFTQAEIEALPSALQGYQFSAPWQFGAAAGADDAGLLYLQIGRFGYQSSENAIAHELAHVLQNVRQPGLFASEGMLGFSEIAAFEQQAYLVGQGGGGIMPLINASFNAYPAASWTATGLGGAAFGYGAYQSSDYIGETVVNYVGGLLPDPIGKYQKTH
jgi:hypothetical protein